MAHDESNLPKWAQDRIEGLRAEIKSLQALKELHSILSDRDREWFPIRNIVASNETVNTLWLLYPNKPHALCSLGKNDVLFVGRAVSPNTREASPAVGGLQDDTQRALLSQWDRERRLLARLASDEPLFYNPLDVMEAKQIRDKILKP